MSKPKPSSVRVWYVDNELSNDVAEVAWDTDNMGLYARVSSDISETEYFYGESAWADAARFASDLQFKVLYS